jgi:hypothetical protein
MPNESQALQQGLKFNYKPMEPKYMTMDMPIGYQTSQG